MRPFQRFSRQLRKRNKPESIGFQVEQLEPRKLLAANPFSAENLLINGDFDEFPIYQESVQYYAASNVGGWQTDDIAVPNLKIQPKLQNDSDYYIELDSSIQGVDAFFQDVPTDLGDEFFLAFKFASGSSNLPSEFDILWNHELVGTYRATSSWQSAGLELPGAAFGSTRLEIREANGPGDGTGTWLDDFYLTEMSQEAVKLDGFERTDSQRLWNSAGRRSASEHFENHRGATDGTTVLKVDTSTTETDIVWRTFNLEPNTTYQAVFDLKAESGTADESNQLRVRWNGEWVDTFKATEGWNRHFVTVTTDQNGEGRLVLREQPHGEDNAGDGNGPLVDRLAVYGLPSSPEERSGTTSIDSFSINDSDLRLVPGQSVRLEWESTGAVDHWLQLWNSSNTAPRDVTSAMAPEGHPDGTIHYRRSYDGMGLGPNRNSFDFVVPDLPGNHRIKLIAWPPGRSYGVASYLDVSIENPGNVSAFVFDQTVSPAQDLWVTWRIKKELLNEHTPAKLIFNSQNDVFNQTEHVLVHPGFPGFTADNFYITDDGLWIKGFTKLNINRNIGVVGNQPFDMTLEIGGQFETAITDLQVNISQPQDAILNPIYRYDQVFGELGRNETTLNNIAGHLRSVADLSHLDSQELEELTNFIKRSLATYELESHYATTQLGATNRLHQMLPTVLNSAFRGEVSSRGQDWSPTRPTVILVHGVNTDRASQYAYGDQFADAAASKLNVVEVHWDEVVTTEGFDRRISEALTDVVNGESNGTVVVDGAAKVRQVVELVRQGYESAGVSNPAESINIIAHSHGTIVTTMAMALSDLTDGRTNQDEAVKNILFVGANLYAEATTAGGELSRAHVESIGPGLAETAPITNLFSESDDIVNFATPILGDIGGGHEGFGDQSGFSVDVINITGVSSFDAMHPAIKPILEGNTRNTTLAIEHSRAETIFNSNSYGWLDWLAIKEAQEDFVTIGVSDQYDQFADYVADLMNGTDSPTSNNHPGSGPGQQSPTLSSVEFSQDEGRSSGRLNVEQGRSVIVSAEGVSDPDGYIVRADFFWDKNRDGFPQETEYLGSDYGPNNGWKRSIRTTDLPLGEVDILGVVVDNDGNPSAAKRNGFNIEDPDSPPDELPSSLPSQGNVDFQIVPHRNGNIYYAGPEFHLNEGRIDLWAIAPRTGRSFNFETYGTTDTVLGIYDFDTGELLEFDEDGGGGDNAELQYFLESEKAYVLAVVSQRNDEGLYELEARSSSQPITEDANIQPPLYSDTVSDSIITPYGFDFIEARAPDTATTVNITLTPDETMDGWIRIENQDHETIATAYLAGTGQISEYFH